VDGERCRIGSWDWREGYGPALAKFIQLIMHTGPLPPDYLDRPAPNPAAFGLPTTDDGSRDDPLLSRNLAMPPFEPAALAKELGVEPLVFPGDHGGFTVTPMSPDNDPAAFAARLRDVLHRP
jgi:hypothetical protein